ncbi:CRISPR-associated endoribonuclease Cas6 [Nocardiopsis sp. Huas11]|uniref:CRISPR system precrRNA processing endoribonuclease RAMP protein Cas6 n=1 Tax=Nocardiopsis sp. Huas11 TaxID=2183912 RepID=UPI000EACA097|nr:CRISPR system precrRNA processing endoribonuclease RAMP protein Cas6 [Nocardiopsis sp. Huas11]RKS07006.1 CRISPR-associated endoribonuclease Cas6 [Nocardiopsis sp. Huas11]
MPTQWSLTPTPPPPPGVSPSHVHALACLLLEDPASEHTAQVKAFTAALPAGTARGSVAASAPTLLLSWLDEPTEPDLASRITGPVRLGSHTAHLSLAARRTVPYTRLAATAPTPRVRVEFTTPAYVNRGGRQLPLPDPELLLEGLARRWAAFSPHPLPCDATAEALGMVHLARHDTRTVPVGTGRHQRTGFVGHAVFGLPRASPAARRSFTALWAFAEFAGVGAQTTHGLGHVRVRLRPETGHPTQRGGTDRPQRTGRNRPVSTRPTPPRTQNAGT